MSKPYDASAKWLLDLNPKAWTKFCGFEVESVRVIDADISSVSATCDKVVYVEDTPPWLVNIELFSWADEEADFTLLFQNVALKRKHGIPTRSAMVLLGGRARSPRYTGTYNIRIKDYSVLDGFHYEVIDASRIPAEDLINMDISLAPLAMAANYPKKQYRDVFHHVQEVIWDKAPLQQAKELVNAAVIFGGLKLPRDLMEKLMLDVLKFKESTAYQIIHERGEAKGIEIGEAKGIVSGQLKEARAFLIRISRKRLGEPSEAVLQRLEAVQDVEAIHRMADRLQEVESWDELIPAKGAS